MNSSDLLNFFEDEGFLVADTGRAIHIESFVKDLEIDVTITNKLHISNFGGIEYHTISPDSLKYIKSALKLYELILKERGI